MIQGTFQTIGGQAVTTTVAQDSFGNLINTANGQQVHKIN
jgi:hypothetical protein